MGLRRSLCFSGAPVGAYLSGNLTACALQANRLNLCCCRQLIPVPGQKVFRLNHENAGP
jgi:hypothetical protein